jgi:DNA-binding MarR family transcriptional regulator
MPDNNASQPPDALQVNYSYLPDLVGHLVGLAHMHATQLCTEQMAPLNLTPKQFVTLEFVANNPEISQKDIAYHVGTTPPVMVTILDDLSERGLLERVRSTQDRRMQFVQITNEGRALLDDIRSRAFAVEHQIDEETGLTPEERTTLLELLRKITNR